MAAQRSTISEKELSKIERRVETQILKKLKDDVHDAVHDGLGSLVHTNGRATPARKPTVGRASPTPTSDREVRNGILEPSPGGLCEAVWKICDKLDKKGKADLQTVTAEAEKAGLNPTNARVELYRWRKFHGKS